MTFKQGDKVISVYGSLGTVAGLYLDYEDVYTVVMDKQDDGWLWDDNRSSDASYLDSFCKGKNVYNFYGRDLKLRVTKKGNIL